MKIQIGIESIYISDDIVGVARIIEIPHYSEDIKKMEYAVEVMSRMGAVFPIYVTNNKDNAIETLNKVGELLKKEKPEKNYIDGFKDGTEYALKLLEKKD